MVLNEINRSACKVYSLMWSEFGSSLSSAVRSLRNLEDLSDVTVSAGGKIFAAHKLILSAASPLLMELLKNAKCQHPILMLAGISSSDFETILDFVYEGEVNIDSEKLPSLLQAAQLLDIQALSPSALVLNSSAPTGHGEDDILSSAIPNKTVTPSSKVSPKEGESLCASLKRKRSSRPAETSDISGLNSCKKSCPIPNGDNGLASQPPSTLPVITDDSNSQEDEKKIISDLPVNCKLCGVTIRQSRNLRRHIDHMHLKQTRLRSKSKEANGRGEAGTKSAESTFKVAAGLAKKLDDPNNKPRGGSSTVLNFSEDSFTQLTEEILSCAAASTLSSAGEGSFSSAQLRMPSSGCAAIVEPLADSLDRNSCLSMASSPTSNVDQAKSSTDEQCSSEKTYECSGLEDSCSMNDITLKELETQLFSVCFCSADNEDLQQ